MIIEYNGINYLAYNIEDLEAFILTHRVEGLYHSYFAKQENNRIMSPLYEVYVNNNGLIVRTLTRAKNPISYAYTGNDEVLTEIRNALNMEESPYYPVEELKTFIFNGNINRSKSSHYTRIRQPHPKAVYLDHVVYPSYSAAEKATGLNHGVIGHHAQCKKTYVNTGLYHYEYNNEHIWVDANGITHEAYTDQNVPDYYKLQCKSLDSH